MTENQIGDAIVRAAIRVHRNTGPGLLESTYQACLEYELKRSALFIEKEVGLPVVYEDVKLECGYRVDLWVEQKVVIEVKSVEAMNDIHMAQILTYLKLSDSKLGYLLNFNVPMMKDGIRRVVNNL
ncbi:MAG: GxxExxY protein [Balneolaceae bacterium]|nr:GxxExxY protein [Balneolaceae bacterium]